MQHIPDETQEEVQIETAKENKNAAIFLAQQAHTSIDIFTQNMDTEIYNNKIFEQAIFNLVKQHPSTLVRILTQDSKHAVQNGHCLIRLSQSLTSSIMIHNPSPEHKNERANFMVVDRTGLLYRTATTRKNYNATFNLKSPQRAAALVDFFNNIWQYSAPDAQTRRIHV